MIIVQNKLFSGIQPYVYAHYAMSGECLYVGSGIGGRALSYGGRSARWKEVMSYHDCVRVDIVTICTSRSDAWKLERELIREKQPVANSVGTKRFSEERKIVQRSIQNRPELRAKLSAVMTEVQRRPEVRERQSLAQKERWKKLKSSKVKQLCTNPEKGSKLVS